MAGKLERFIVTVAMTAVVSRGLIELITGDKRIAYIIQGFLWILSMLLLRQPRGRARKVYAYAAFAVFVTADIASVLLTVASGHGSALGAAFYGAVMGSVAWAFLVGATRVWSARGGGAALGAATVASVALLIGGLGQEVGGMSWLIGSSTAGGLVRPSSLTGSYLHYPLALSLLAVVMAQAGIAEGRARYAVLGAVMAAATVASLSRSGDVIILGAGAVSLGRWILSKARLRVSRKQSIAVAVGSAAIVVCLGGAVLLTGGGAVDRIASAWNPEAVGNPGRIEAWKIGVTLWLKSPILLGDRTGQITNATQNFNLENGMVVESSLLSLLDNFGLFGATAVYMLIGEVIAAIDPTHKLMRAGAIAAAAATLFYQSIEVLPFVALIAWYPALSSAIKQRTDGRTLAGGGDGYGLEASEGRRYALARGRPKSGARCSGPGGRGVSDQGVGVGSGEAV